MFVVLLITDAPSHKLEPPEKPGLLTFQIRREPKLKIRLPVLVHRQPPSKLAPHESRKQRHGNPKNQTSAKVALSLGYRA
ncbi:hypothetical protein K9B33_12540 [Sphingobium sp. 3R8]|uniref:hypothetical protein n=1 Tax=Sphingobium sp. 3R8 TaxID=2874921 RepID=UPI001CCEE104|nr:hypothetical protein [Sphingobium sp. 3R8]MBZ9648378.1 hypothetical protein [Sphingobium sp. 3R8]